jgi:aconitate hydratase
VIGFRITGKLPEGTTATDLVLTVTQMLRKKGVVGKFVDLSARASANLSVEDRATIGNMAPEYGATCGLFPIEDDTISYLTATGRDPQRVALVEPTPRRRACGAPTPAPTGVHRYAGARPGTVVPSLAARSAAGRVALSDAARSVANAIAEIRGQSAARPNDERGRRLAAKARPCSVDGKQFDLEDGHVVIAAITSCTNTSHPSVLIGAGSAGQEGNERGLARSRGVKTSLAPGSQVVTEYLEKAGLQEHLDASASTWSAMAAPPASAIRAA